MALSVIELLATGGIAELLERLGCLGEAAWDGFGLIEGEIWKELLGFDLTKPLGPQLQAEQEGEAGAEGSEAGGDPVNLEFLLQQQIRNDQVSVEPVTEGVMNDIPPEIGVMPPGGTFEIGRATEPERSTEGVMMGLLGHLPQEPAEDPASASTAAAPQATEATNPDAAQMMADPEMKEIMDRLVAAQDRSERLSVLKDLFWAGLKKFWRDKIKPNLWWIIPAALLAVAAFVALEVLTGGLITAALPVIMEVVGVLFIGYDIARVAAGMVDWLSLGWDKKVAAAAKAFAHAIAVGLVAILMFLLFEGVGKALKAAFKGLARGARVVGRGAAALVRTGARVGRAAVRGIVRGVLYVGRLAIKAFRVVAKMVAKAGTYVLEKGRLLFKGLERMFPEAGQSVRKMFAKLKAFFGHFRGFVARREGEYLDVYAEFNPEDILILRVRITLAQELKNAMVEKHGLAGRDVPARAATVNAEMSSGYGRGADPANLSEEAQKLGRQFDEPFEFTKWKRDPPGSPGLANASHAEPKLAAGEIGRGNTDIAIGVNKEVCDYTCKPFFSRLAKHLKKPIIIADPATVFIFDPEGTVRLFSHEQLARLFK